MRDAAESPLFSALLSEAVDEYEAAVRWGVVKHALSREQGARRDVQAAEAAGEHGHPSDLSVLEVTRQYHGLRLPLPDSPRAGLWMGKLPVPSYDFGAAL